MADDYRIAHDPKTGQNYVRLGASDDWQPISVEDVDRLKESGAEAFVNSAANSIAQAALGTRMLGNRLIGREEDWVEPTLQQFRGAQEMRSEGAPIASFAGSIAPDVAVGAVTGGTGTLARRAALTGAVEGTLGAVRNPEAPLRGAIIQGGIGTAVPVLGAGVGRGVRAVTGNRTADRILGSIDRGTDGLLSRGAAEEMQGATFGGRVASSARRVAEDMGGRARNLATNRPTTLGRALADVETDPFTARRGSSTAGALQLEDAPRTVASQFGNVSDDIPLSSAEARWAAATSDDARDAGIAARERAQISKSNSFNPGGEAQRLVEEERQAWGTRRILDQLGLVDQGHTRMTDEALAQGFRNEQEIFRRYIDNAASNDMPIGTRWADDAAEGGEPMPARSIGERAQELLDDTPEGFQTASHRKAVEQLQDLSRKPDASGREFQTVWNHIQKARERFTKRGSANPEAAALMGDLMELLQEALTRSLPSEGVERLGLARRRWGLLNDLTRGRVIDQNAGTVNFRTFRNNRARRDSLFRSGRRSGQSFEADMRFLAALDEELVPDSGTASRLIPYLAATTGIGALGGAANLLGD